MSADLEIRNVTEEDCAALRHLAQQCEPLDVHTHYTYWVLCKFFSAGSFIMIDKEGPCGYITSIETEDRIFVWQIGILNRARNKGNSKLLIESVLKYAISRNKNMSVSIAEENKKSYYSFDAFCKSHSYRFIRTGMLSLKDLKDVSFAETEVIYDITINEEWDQRLNDKISYRSCGGTVPIERKNKEMILEIPHCREATNM